MVVITSIIVVSLFVLMRGTEAGRRDDIRKEDVAKIENALYAYFKMFREYPVCPLASATSCLGILVEKGFLDAIPEDPARRWGRTVPSCEDSNAHVYCYKSLNGRDFVVTFILEGEPSQGRQHVGPATY